MEFVAEGAEAKVFFDGGEVVKSRVSKGYRISQIDDMLRKFRTRREAKVFQRLAEIGFPVPKLIGFSDKDMTLRMGRVSGSKVRDVLSAVNCNALCGEIGEKVGILHNAGIIHGDLTTSNFILSNEDNVVYFIDFGLSFFSDKVEDMAVDLHLLRQALESKHHEFWEQSYEAALDGYSKTAKRNGEVIKRLAVVESRGRYKGKGS